MRRVNPAWVGFLALLAWTLLPAKLPAKLNALFYYIPSKDSWASVSSHAQKISMLGPQVFTVDGSGAVSGSVEEKVRQLASQHAIPLVPLLTNEGFSAEIAHRILDDSQLRQQVISQALRLCLANGCSGLQLDFEDVLQEDGPKYTQFVREASGAFHARHLTFTVALPSPLFTGTMGRSAYREWFGDFGVSQLPYDYEQIAALVDFISLMTYDNYGHGTAPGPIAGYAWVEQSLRFVLRQVPPEKLSLGLGLYGRRWCGQQVTDSAYPEVDLLVQRTHSVLRWHSWHRSPWFEYRASGCRSIVWFENRRSLREKLKLVRQYRLAGFSAWRLGQEDPEFWRDVPRRGSGPAGGRH